MKTITLHGHRVSYREQGSGPVVVLLHGITGSTRTWDPVIEELAADHTVVAPDLLGHGESAKPRGDYSMGSFASGVRDLLAALGHERATVVGHSLGGGIAMQLAYQFPHICSRLVLVSSGGLGRQVHPMLRAATLPGAELVLPVIAHARLIDTGRVLGRLVRSLGLDAGPDLAEISRGFASLADVRARMAFLHSARAVIDVWGQRVSARDRLYLAAKMPTLVLWGENDPIIPVAHGRAAHADMPGSRLEVFEGAGHFPHVHDPMRFVSAVRSFVDETVGAEVEIGDFRDLLLGGERAAEAEVESRPPSAVAA